MMPFKLGHAKMGGRAKGVSNKVTTEVRDLARSFVEDPDYQANLRRRLKRGRAANMEPMLWQYAFGRPSERPAGTGFPSLAELLEEFWQRRQQAKVAMRSHEVAVDGGPAAADPAKRLERPDVA